MIVWESKLFFTTLIKLRKDFTTDLHIQSIFLPALPQLDKKELHFGGREFNLGISKDRS